MKLKILLQIILLFSILINMNAQDLSQYRWQNRLVLLLTNDETNPEYLQQLKIVEGDKKGVEERKIIVYRSTPNVVYTGAEKKAHNTANEKIYKKYKKSDSAFEIILIGLDGGEKLRKESCIPLEELYALIDIMPMRQAEIRRNDN